MVQKAALRIVDLDKIQVDQSYQRTVKPKHKRIIADFNPDALGVPLVGEREDGSLWIVDGLQRITALEEMGRKQLRAEVFASRGPEHEAEVFKIVNANRTRLSAGELFHAALTAGDELAWKIKKIVEESGFVLNLIGPSTNSPIHGTKLHQSSAYADGRAVSCVNTMQTIVKGHGKEEKKYGEVALRFALRVAKEAWPGDPLGLYNIMLGGLAKFYIRRQGKFDQEVFVNKAKTVQPQKLLNSAGLGVFDKTSNMVELLEKIYRKKLAVNRGK
jgi:hypothetical protein